MTKNITPNLENSRIRIPDSLCLPADLQSFLFSELEKLEFLLLEATGSVSSLANTTSRYLIEAGGKRIRPILAILVSQLGKADTSKVIEAAAVVELTHLATLYHDDVMDSALVRRGVPAANKVWGNNVAILTGDLLFSKASLLLSKLGPEALNIQAVTFERLCLGQLNETVGPEDSSDPLQHYFQVLADKTGSLISAAVQFGALFSGISNSSLKMLIEYGENLGVAFQLADDVLDITTPSFSSGKLQGIDLREGIATLPVLLLRKEILDGVSDKETMRISELLDSDLDSQDALDEAVSALNSHYIIQKSWDIAKSWADKAATSIADLPEGDVKNALLGFATMSVNRDF